MVVADCLVDYKMGGTINTMQKTKPDGGNKSNADRQRNGITTDPKSGENMQ